MQQLSKVTWVDAILTAKESFFSSFSQGFM